MIFKKMSIYNGLDACDESCIILLYTLPYYIFCYTRFRANYHCAMHYMFCYTRFDKFIGFVHNSLCFSKNIYLILNRHEQLYTQTLFHKEVFTHRNFNAQMPKLLHTGAFAHTRLTKRSFYTEAFAQRCLYKQKLLHTEAFTQRSL